MLIAYIGRREVLKTTFVEILVAILYSPCRVEVDFVLLSDLRLELTEADSLLAVEDSFWMTEGCLTFWENQ